MFSTVFFGKTTSDSDKETICKKIDSSVNIICVNDTCPQRQKDNSFILTQPVNHEAVTNLLTAIITDTKKPSMKTKDPPGRILIAEDNKEHLAILIDLLKRLNYTDIDTVSDGLELYIKLTSRASVYQMVFVNVHIGVLDGITVVKRYKQTVLSPVIHTMIIGMSDNHDLKDQCYDAGMNGYIVKPVKQKDLNHIGI
jgi:CheY-like chemotaxis protein